jgi:multidrug efflux pump subunit AcrA (membrane-fusion protein)
MPLLTVEDPASYRLEVRLDEARAALVQIGQAVPVRVDSTTGEGDEWLDARVVEIARVDPVSHAFLVKLDLPASASWRSGLFGRARFPGPARRALIAPASSLVNRGQLTFVYLVDGDRRARLRPISIGVSGDHGIEVLAGLREGDVVVVNPPTSLIDGARVAGEPR